MEKPRKPDWITQELWDDMVIWEDLIDCWITISAKKLDAQILGPAVAEMLARTDEAQN